MTPHIRVGLAFDYHLAYARGVVRGVKQYVQARPDWVLVPLDQDGLTPAMVQAAGPAGLIAHAVTDAQVAVLRSAGRPVVGVGSVLPEVPFPRVGVNHREVGGLAAAHLLDRGFRDFGFVGHPRHLYSVEREEGFRAALPPGRHTLTGFYEHPRCSYRLRGRLLMFDAGLRAWLLGLPKPAGVFACHDVWALQVAEGCRLAGLRVPDDVAVVGVDNDDLLCDLARPSLSSVMFSAERVGAEAAALLARLLAGGRPPAGPVLVPPSGVATRQSTDVLAVADPEVAAALRYIRAQAHAPLRVADVLRAVPVSRRALERKFRAVLDRGLGEEIRKTHVDRAKHLLAATDLSMADVADRSGFTSQPQLSRVFREETGVKPSAYRRRVRAAGGA